MIVDWKMWPERETNINTGTCDKMTQLTVERNLLVRLSLLVLFSFRLWLLGLSRVHELVHKSTEGIHTHRLGEVISLAARRLNDLLEVGNQVAVFDV